MSEHDLTPLSPLAKALMGVERARPDVSAEASQRVFERLASSIGIPAPVPPAPPVPPAAPPAPPPATAPPVPAAAAGPVAAKAGLLATASFKSAALLAGVFLAGGATGIVVRDALPGRSGAPSAVVVASAPAAFSATVMPSASASTASEPAPSAALSATAPAPPVANAAPSLPRASASSSRDADLAGERPLIERAQMALARGQSAEALDAVRAHARDFPRGRLREEREAIAVQALVQAGRTEEARGRAALFRSSFPQSVFLPAVNAAVERH